MYIRNELSGFRNGNTKRSNKAKQYQEKDKYLRHVADIEILIELYNKSYYEIRFSDYKFNNKKYAMDIIGITKHNLNKKLFKIMDRYMFIDKLSMRKKEPSEAYSAYVLRHKKELERDRAKYSKLVVKCNELKNRAILVY